MSYLFNVQGHVMGCLFLYCFIGTFYILWIIIFYKIKCWKYLPSLWLSFTLLLGSFDEQRFLILIMSHLSIFFLKYYLPIPKSWRYFLLSFFTYTYASHPIKKIDFCILPELEYQDCFFNLVDHFQWLILLTIFNG